MKALTKTDRCDRCHQAQAYIAWAKGDLVLMFCGHHNRQHALSLTASGWTVAVDIADQLAEPTAAGV